MTAPYGPHRIGQNRQVALPSELMRAVHLEPGDSVYLQVNPDGDGTLTVIPVEIATAWFEAGRTSAKADERQSDRANEG